ncbi:MAG: hypothetical protein JW857_03445 [Bacteroidales bacterium]|nr:hypothetical protein [Bacteroidales bacterium]
MIMVRKSKKNIKQKYSLILWLFTILFLVLAILNLIFVHPVPAIFYALLCLLYLPAVNFFLASTIGFTIPIWVKITLGLMVLWATLAVGDLMEMFEAWMLN